MRGNVNYLALALLVGLTLTSCADPVAGCWSDHPRLSGCAETSQEERDRLKRLGEAGAGWAYAHLASDPNAGSELEREVYQQLALEKGDSITNARQSLRLTSEAARTNNTEVRRTLLIESRRRIDIAVRHSFDYPERYGRDRGIANINAAIRALHEFDKQDSGG